MSLVIGPLIATPAGALVLDDPIDLLGYQRDTSVAPAGVAGMVVRPTAASQVSLVLKEASTNGVPVYVRGGGTMYAGGVNPTAGGVVLDMSGLDRILDIDLDAGVVVVEPGVLFGELSAALKPLGMTVGIIPLTSPSATVGGAASAHALGTGSARFQSFADEVVGLEVVLPTGGVVRTGSAAANAARYFHRYGMGPDLTGLFLGGDATLGVITAIALWVHPLPAMRETACFGLPSPAAAAAVLIELQRSESLRNVWYSSGYESGAVRGRVLAAHPQTDPSTLPGFCLGFEFGGEAGEVARDRARVLALVKHHGGADFPVFNDIFYARLRGPEAHWYPFAGYFARSRCGILMSSLPTAGLPAFIAALGEIRQRWPAFQWGGAVVVCRRGLHGGVMGFYDEASEWTAMQDTMRECAVMLIAAGCIPYKTGKLWAGEVRKMDAWHELLGRLKSTLDPAGVLSPGNLGLPRQAADD